MNNNGNSDYNNAGNSNGVRPISVQAMKKDRVGLKAERRRYPSAMETVNTIRDAGDYGRSGCKHDVTFDGNNLYQAMADSRSGSLWKGSVQRYCMDWLIHLGSMQETGHCFEFSPTHPFTLSERGRTRVIDGELFDDRVVSHSLCDNVITPAIRSKLIYDNCASLKGRGISQARSRLVTHLSRFYRSHGSNDGYILLMDFAKYYDNIRHDVLMAEFSKYIHDPRDLALIEKSISRGKVDVSYMTDDEYETCMDEIFNSIEYKKIPKSKLTGEKYMRKHLCIGNQISQSAGILYPHMLDNYIKTVLGIKYYARYMDDSYIIHESKEYLKNLLDDLCVQAQKYGIFINRKKTRICKLSSCWRYLQIQYSLTDTGRIVRKINPKQITRQRRKMKKLAGHLSEKDYSDWFRSWFYSSAKYMSYQQKKNISALFDELMETTYGKTDTFKWTDNRKSVPKRK